jgi:hypothetical protein
MRRGTDQRMRAGRVGGLSMLIAFMKKKGERRQVLLDLLVSIFIRFLDAVSGS